MQRSSSIHPGVPVVFTLSTCTIMMASLSDRCPSLSSYLLLKRGWWDASMGLTQLYWVQSVKVLSSEYQRQSRFAPQDRVWSIGLPGGTQSGSRSIIRGKYSLHSMGNLPLMRQRMDCSQERIQQQSPSAVIRVR